MKRLIIVCEGPTEQEFCKDVLQPYFQQYDISVVCPLIKKSGGGIITWEPLKRQLRNHLFEEGAYVTMLVDYYRLKDPDKIPGWSESLSIQNKQKRMHFLFDQMKLDMDETLRDRFIPYIQLHEFEGLLFSDLSPYQEYFGSSICDFKKLEAVITSHPNPEMINEGPNTAPSKRLMDIISGYDKVLYGGVLAMSLGLQKIREHCPMFNEWISTLQKIS